MREQMSLTEKEISLGEEPVKNRGVKRWRGIVLLALAAVIAAGFFAISRSRKEPASNAGAAAGPSASPTANLPVDVSTAAAITRGTQRSVEVVGSLAADEEVVIGAQAAGELSQLNVDFGSYVSQGQVIALIDQRDAKLKVEQAEASLKQTMARLGMKEGAKFDPQEAADVRVAKAAFDWAKMDLDRAARLVENGDISRSVYDQAVISHSSAQARYQASIDAVNQQLALVEQQRAALALARKSIADTIVRSPISGAVKEKHSSRGTYLPVNGKIVTLVKINPLRLRADIPEYAAGSVRTGQVVTLTVDAFPDRTFRGKVVRIGPSLDEKTRALTFEAEVSNPGNQLRPGMFAKSQLITAKDSPAIMVPQKAVVTVAGLNKLFVIENGKAVERIVKLGATDGDMIEITEGVRDGEMVATTNLDRLETGVAVAGEK